MAINRAMSQYINKSIYEMANFSKSAACIFISHKSEDLNYAVELGRYIMVYGNIDIYLDNNDKGLRDAVSRGDDKRIVECIELGLSRSTHLLCVISDKTYTSWWVPYEIGMAKSIEKNIASIQLKNIEDVPSFLKIEKVITGTKSLNEYLEQIRSRYKILLENYLPSNSMQKHPLDSILNWQK